MSPCPPGVTVSPKRSRKTVAIFSSETPKCLWKTTTSATARGPRWTALARLDRLINTAPPLPAARRFAAHLVVEFPALLSFLWDPRVDATNWRAEHAIRPAVVNRKVCGGNRTPHGAHTQQILASVVRTARQRRFDLNDVFTTLLPCAPPDRRRRLPTSDTVESVAKRRRFLYAASVEKPDPCARAADRDVITTTRTLRLVYNRRQMTLIRLSAIARRRARELACREEACMVAFLVALVIASATSCRAVRTPPVDPRYEQQLQPLLEQFVQWQEIPGLAIGIVENNQLVYAHAFGLRHLGRPAEPLTTRSLFHMASVTKPFVGTAIMQLVERGSLDLDAPVVKYLPYFRLADDRYNLITVRQMVTHTSGMPDVEDYEWDKPQYDDGALERYVRSLTDQKLLFAPGERVQYSNMAFEVLGDVVAKASGESFDDYVQRHILAPLQMTDSTLLLKQANPALLTLGHELDEQGAPAPSRVFPYNRMHSPSSNLHSNVLDMARWAIANLNRGELEGRRILQASTHDMMWRPAHHVGGARETGPPSGPGISWWLGVYRGTRMIMHEGGDTGYRTDLALLPDKRIAVVWMENADWAAHDDSLMRAALDAALGERPAPVRTRRTIESTLPTYQREGIEAALKQYRMLRQSPRAELYSFDEGALDAFGHYLIRQGRLRDAIRALETNVEMCPASGRAADALATAYEMGHNVPLAIRTYRTAVTLDPTLTHARDRLKALNR